MRWLSIPLNRGQRGCAGFRIIRCQLKLHERCGNHAAYAGVGLKLFVFFLGRGPDLGPIRNIKQADVAVFCLFGKDKEAGLFVEPHVFGLPPLQHDLRLG